MSAAKSPTLPISVGVIIVAAGRGERAGQADGPKQYREIGGKAVIRHVRDALASHPLVGRIVVAIHPDDEALYRAAAGNDQARTETVLGGSSRQQSTLNALRVFATNPPAVVLIHDAVRPFIDHALIDRVIGAVSDSRGAIPCMPVADTLKRSEGGSVETVDRSSLYSAQTPQGFPFARILAAHEAAAASGRTAFTDDASIAEAAGLPVTIVEGSPRNTKLTWAGDIATADRLMTLQTLQFPDVRTGNGYDVHALVEGDHVTLCGVRIPHRQGLEGHSDADVGLHALTDALLATCGAGDIGDHFPPSDPQWRGAASRLFVEHAASIVRGRGGRIANADISLICEAPKISPHRETMRETIAGMLRIDIGRVSVKATTNERLGFVGRSEGIAAIATASVVYPGSVAE